jgi:hypothetical protein
MICPQCEECNLLIDNHSNADCHGNHSIGRPSIQSDYQLKDIVRPGTPFHLFCRKPQN